jgi:hypothetical protein
MHLKCIELLKLINYLGTNDYQFVIIVKCMRFSKPFCAALYVTIALIAFSLYFF